MSPHRSYAMTTLSLDDAKVVKNAFGTTLNDVVMAMCATALRSYTDTHGEKLDQDLVAMVPMSVRTDDQSGAGGNRISSMLASLATTIDDPVERLLAISRRHAPGEGSAERDRCDDAAGLGRVRRTGGVRASRARRTRGIASPTDTGRSSTSRSRTFLVRRSPCTPQARGWSPTTRWARSTTVPG